MKTEENKSLVLHYIQEAWDKGNTNVIDELIAADYIQHAQGIPPGREGVKQFFAMIRTAFPDIRQTVDEMIAEGDKVVWRWTMHGTHEGMFQGIPATGKPVKVTGMNIIRIADGKLAENWAQIDTLGLLQQLGVIPSPETKQ